MLVSWVNRAEIALRTLENGERRRVQSAIERLRDVPPGGLARVPEIKAMTSANGLRYYAYNIGDDMRLVFSVSGDGARIEDIAPRSRVERVA